MRSTALTLLSVMLLATTAFGQNTNPGTSSADQPTTPTSAQELEEVVVTGTLIRGETAPTGSQLMTVSPADIAATGATSTANLLATVPALNSFNIAPQGGQAEFNSGGSSTPGLHGLPGTATLVLIDGHRLVGDTPLLTVPDPSSIPAEAIDHVEIVADGGFAIYGSDAVAGVINIILKHNFNGASTTVSYGGANGYNTAMLGETLGKTWDSGSALLSANYSSNSDVPNKDRNFYTANLLSVGGTDTRTTFCTPPNLSVGGVNYAAPYVSPGVATSCDPSADADMFNQERRYGLIGDMRQDVGDRVHLSLDAKYTDDLSGEFVGPDTEAVTIPSTNPYFIAVPGSTATSETVDWNTGNLGRPRDEFRSRSGMTDAGATIEFTRNWVLSTDLDYSWSWSSSLNAGTNVNALTAAASATDPSTALDPFGTRTNPQVGASIQDWPLYFLGTQRLYDFNATLNGTLFPLPGGDVKLALGGANRHEDYEGSNPIGIAGQAGYSENYESASRVIDSAFGELAIPIVGERNALPAIKSLTFSVAGRFDHYSDFGNTTNPKYGLDWTPLDGLKFGASYGTSFHAPQLADVNGIDTRAMYIPDFPLIPPGLPPGTLLNTVIIAGGRLGLQPETAKTASFGVDFQPAALPGFGMNLTYWLIRFSDEVEIPPTGGDELFVVPGLSSRFTVVNPAGIPLSVLDSVLAGVRLLPPLSLSSAVQEIIDLRRANIGATDEDGWDFDFHYRHNVGPGAWSAGLSGEYIFKYESNEGPGTVFTDNLTSGNSYQTSDTSAYNVIPWHARLSTGWQQGPFSSQLFLNYTGHFNFGYVNSAGGSSVQWVAPFVTVDWVAAWDFSATSGWAKNSRVQLNVYNLLNQPPPLVIQAGGFSPESANPLGRTIQLLLNKRF